MVVDGDTLSEIATKFGTTAEALVLANGLADADSLVIGQLLKVTGATPLTPTPTGTATAAVTPSATPAP